MYVENKSIIIWSFFLGIFLVICAVHFFENKKIKSHLLINNDSETIKHFIRFSWSRSIQILTSAIVLLAVIFIYENQLNSTKQQLLALQESKSLEKIISDIKIEDGETKDLDTKPVFLEEIANDTSAGNNIHDIFDSLSEADNNIYNLKTNYEGLLVNHFLMKKCGKAGKDDYQIITVVLQNETTKLSAPANLIDDILIAADGSYQELYSNIECNDPIIANIEPTYNSYITKLSEKLTSN